MRNGMPLAGWPNDARRETWLVAADPDNFASILKSSSPVGAIVPLSKAAPELPEGVAPPAKRAKRAPEQNLLEASYALERAIGFDAKPGGGGSDG